MKLARRQEPRLDPHNTVYYRWGDRAVLIAPRSGYTAARAHPAFESVVPAIVPPGDHTILISRDPFERWVSGVYHYSVHAHRTSVAKIVPRYMDYIVHALPTTEDFERFFEAVTVCVEKDPRVDYHYSSVSRYVRNCLGTAEPTRVVPCAAQEQLFGTAYVPHNINTHYHRQDKRIWLERARPVLPRLQQLWSKDWEYHRRSLNEWSTLSTRRP